MWTFRFGFHAKSWMTKLAIRQQVKLPPLHEVGEKRRKCKYKSQLMGSWKAVYTRSSCMDTNACGGGEVGWWHAVMRVS